MESIEKSPKIMLTIKEATEMTGLSYSCIRRLCLNNEIKFVRSGTKYYVNTASLLRYCGQVCTA